MSAADASMRLRRPQRLVVVAAVLVVLAAGGSLVVPLLHLPPALLALPDTRTALSVSSECKSSRPPPSGRR